MKKSKFITGLSAAFISAMALMSCSSLIKARGHVVLTIDGQEYTAEELFNDQKTPAAAEAKFNAVYKVAVRNYFVNGEGQSLKDEIEKETKIKISEQKATAQSNADKNGTSYATEWQKILDANNVDDENGLRNKFEYDIQKEKFENNFYDNNYAALRNGTFPGISEKSQKFFKNYLSGKQPYHMKHILVKINGLGNNNTDGTITADEADKLYKVINELALGNKSFDEISSLYSDDEAAKKDYASLGIMSRDTSFVDDFKLGTYFYESYYGSSTQTDTTAIEKSYQSKKALDEFFGKSDARNSAFEYAEEIKTNVIDPTTSSQTIGVIPFEAALKLGKKTPSNPKGLGDLEFKDTELGNAGIKKEDFKDKFLPRNVLFNKYFNKHNIMIIAPASLPTSTFTYDTDVIKQDTNGSHRIEKDKYGCILKTEYINTTGTGPKYFGFNQDEKNDDKIVTNGDTNLENAIVDNNTQHVLRDNEGRVVIAFRSGTGGSSTSNDDYQGIHFVVIERSPFIGKEFDDDSDPASESKRFTTLDEYYTEYYPDQPSGDHPKYDDGTGDYKHTFANYIMIDKPINKKEKADKVKSELKNCMSNLNTFIYEYLLNNGDHKIVFNDTPEAKAIEDSINSWISINREDAEIEKDHSWANNWQNYCYSLEAKADERKEVGTTTTAINSRLVPEYCVTAITDEFTYTGDHHTALAHMFGVGGVFHE